MSGRLIAHLALALLALLVAAPTAPAAKKKKTPTITSVSPMRLGVGAKLTIKGRNFSAKRKRNTVFFRGAGGRSAFAKPIRASSKKLVVVVPSAVARLLSDGGTEPTRIRLRVLAGKFGKYTPSRLSPVVVPVGGGGSPGGGGGGTPGGGGGPGGQGDPGGPSGAVCTGDDPDNDLLSSSLELQLGTDHCNGDTDGDGVEDGFEYKSAVDLNDGEYQDPNTAPPFPGKRPYPNPGVKGQVTDETHDANIDFDGDSLSLGEEQALWKFTIGNGGPRTLFPLSYSDGEQYSVSTRGSDGRRNPNLPTAGYAQHQSFLNWASANGYRNVMLSDGEPWYDGTQRTSYPLLDFNRSGAESASAGGGYWRAETTYFDFDADSWLSDDERDEDADGLTNYDEQHGRMVPGYWAACYAEDPYYISYAGTNYLDADSDGDGVRDGADDQDNDDIPNLMELSRNAASGLNDTNGSTCTPAVGLPTPPNTHHPDAYGRVNPLNPCLPATWARTCTRHPSFEGTGAPFDGSPNWYSLN